MMAPSEERLNDLLASSNPVETSSGAWSGNTRTLTGWLNGIRCRPLTASTKYHLKIEDRDGYEIVREEGLVGDFIQDFHPIPIRGIHTVYIFTATRDETFEIKLMVTAH